ncbi:Ribosome biogenesis GTPase [Desulfonema limicola]|uniref:Small ribosomal subunit biogenesis GTPase RsgA n=1 Tax=Desulfonema limicola TaxID=45656 RepID=A0A975GHB3_9BACT|nr:ribosome small subunit-dependent GTPase A [Desulfonema limicola]QTA81147.1 Ribosome biogenesis GTPase [Desulfonema limicola]
MNIKKLGFDKWFLDRIDASKSDNYEISRVTAVNKDSFQIMKDAKQVFAEVTGKILFNADSPKDFPTVGDWVYARFYDNDTFAVIHEVIPRKSLLKRKTAGRKNEYQLIAANIDTAFIIQSFGSDYNLRRLERYLVIVNEGNISPVVLLSKSDLAPEHERNRKLDDIKILMPNIEIIEFSNISLYGINKIKDILIPGKTYCLLGSSGSGKTTLLNNLSNDYVFETNEVREKDGKGRHTTTRRQLIHLENDAVIIDTPGMRELGNIDVSTGINETFKEIVRLSEQCLYNNCTHTNENGCAILQALQDKVISQERYQNFVKMNKETAYNEMSYFEKRKKDKNFGKLCKSIIKNKQKRK